ncbi:hypothetical protein AHiyo1_42840 [Arthrobacter sp. Hiyo1]|nr:hypothetical protein AHiyo1_42840 [Arthrobacter sp. Hiyo1]
MVLLPILAGWVLLSAILVKILKVPADQVPVIEIVQPVSVREEV